MLDISIDGQRYQEMHVDGGAVAQAFLYPPTLNLKTNSERYGISVSAWPTSFAMVAFSGRKRT